MEFQKAIRVLDVAHMKICSCFRSWLSSNHGCRVVVSFLRIHVFFSNWTVNKTLVICCTWGIMLPSCIGIIISHYKLYGSRHEPINMIEFHKAIRVLNVAHMKICLCFRSWVSSNHGCRVVVSFLRIHVFFRIEQWTKPWLFAVHWGLCYPAAYGL